MNEYVEHKKVATSLNPSEGETFQRYVKLLVNVTLVSPFLKGNLKGIFYFLNKNLFQILSNVMSNYE